MFRSLPTRVVAPLRGSHPLISTSSACFTTTGLASPLLGESTVDVEEVAKFSALSERWWLKTGEFAPLHSLNETRVRWINSVLSEFQGHMTATTPSSGVSSGLASRAVGPLSGLRILDVGCGGGILSEALARLGAEVTGIDPSKQNISAATVHLETPASRHLSSRLSYKSTTAEELAATGLTFDVVCSLEVVEHVNNPWVFLETCASLVKPGGGLFISTINQTLTSLALAIYAAENVLRWVPKGTHDWTRFLEPAEVEAWLGRGGLTTVATTGFRYRVLHRDWALAPNDLSVNYALFALKPHASPVP